MLKCFHNHEDQNLILPYLKTHTCCDVDRALLIGFWFGVICGWILYWSFNR